MVYPKSLIPQAELAVNPKSLILQAELAVNPNSLLRGMMILRYDAAAVCGSLPFIQGSPKCPGFYIYYKKEVILMVELDQFRFSLQALKQPLIEVGDSL